MVTSDLTRTPSELTPLCSVEAIQHYYRYYPLASVPQVCSEISSHAYERVTQSGSFLLEQIVETMESDPKITFLQNNLKSAKYKTQLKEQLINERIDFDSYRAGETGKIDVDDLRKKLGFSGSSRINIHESDFPDFKLSILQNYSSFRFDPDNERLYCPKYYNCSNKEVDIFKDYMECLLVAVDNKCMGANDDKEFDYIDTRLAYDQIFDPYRFW